MPRITPAEFLQQNRQQAATTSTARAGFDAAKYQEAKSRIQTVGVSPQGEDGPLLRDIGTGAAKELGSTGIGIGSIGRVFQKGLSKGVDALFGTEGFGLSGESVFDKGSDKQVRAQEFLTPEGGAEKTGAFLTEAATFAVPGTQASKATKGAGLLRRAGALAASDAGAAATQAGELNREAVDAGIIAAAFPVAGRAGSLVGGVLPSGADAGARVVNSLIKPLLKDFSYGANPGRAVAEAGITANSLDDLAVGIRNVRQETGQQIGDIVSQSTARFDANDSFKAIDEAIVEAQKSPRTNAAIISRLQNLKDDLLQAGEDGIPTRQLNDLSASELFELKKDIGDLTRWTGNATDDEIVNKALKQTYGRIKGQLDENVEGISELTTKYADLRSAEIATQYRDKIAARQNLISFSGAQLGTVAAVTSAMVSGGAVIPVLVGAGAAVGTESLKSPAVKTRAAAWLAGASRAEREDAFKKAPWLRAALQAALFDETEENQD